MADGFFELNNFPPDAEEVEESPYSGSDPKVQYATLNQRIRISPEQHGDKCCTYDSKKRGESGLIIREEMN